MRRNASRLALVLLVLTGSLLPGAAPVLAEAHSTRIEAAPMRITGRAVPTADGCVIQPLEEGEASTDPGAVPLDEVPGDCGTSYVEIEPFVGGFDLYTGFTVNTPAIEYSWNARVIGPAYDDGETWGGNLLFRTRWDGTWLGRQVDFSGEYDAIADGFAILSNGLVCTLGVPTDTIFIQS